MKYRMPNHCSAIVHEGEVLLAGADGSIEATEDAASALMAHGVEPWTVSQPSKPAVQSMLRLGDIETMSRSALADALTGLGHKTLPTSTDDMRRVLRRAIAARVA